MQLSLTNNIPCYLIPEMLFVCTTPLKPLSPFTSLAPSPPNTIPKCHPQSERSVTFDAGDTFFRHESSTARDLGVLSAALYKKSHHALKVLDVMCGCGIRSLRYLAEAQADFVLANDANPDCGDIIARNLSRAGSENESWIVKHCDANRVLTQCYLDKEFYDLIDIDSFGSDSTFVRAAFNAVKLGGMLYLTSTDGFSSGGHRPQQTLAAYGAYIKHMPYCNEVGLRMVIGGAVREASVLGYHVVPLFSNYSYHGPVFRIMLQVRRGKFDMNRHYGFISYCNKCGNSRTFTWNDLGKMKCDCSNVRSSLVVSGPLWIGPLHCASSLKEMLNLAEQWDWTGNGTGANLETLINVMIDESDPLLPPGFIKMDEVASRAKVNSPPINLVLHTLRKEGYAASRSHITPNAIKTNCSTVDCVRIVKDLQNASTNEELHLVTEA